MGCSLEKLDGCDQQTIDVITGGNGKTIDEMKDLQNEICSDSDTGGSSCFILWLFLYFTVLQVGNG